MIAKISLVGPLMLLLVAYGSQHSKPQKAIPLDFAVRELKPYIQRKMDTTDSKLTGARTDRYWLLNITYEKSFKRVRNTLVNAGWDQKGGLEWDVDARAVRFESMDGRSIFLAEYGSTAGVELDVETPISMLGSVKTVAHRKSNSVGPTGHGRHR